MNTETQKTNDGGPAFPTLLGTMHGMSLRQWYAGMALQGLLADSAALESMESLAKEKNIFLYEYIAIVALEQADALIKISKL